MEIINIRIYQKDGGLLELYPCQDGQMGFDLSIYQSFLAWAVKNADSSGHVRLEMSEYDTIIELTQWDDIDCPSSFVIEYKNGSETYSLGLSYRKTTNTANIVLAES